MSALDDIVKEVSPQWSDEDVIKALGGEEVIQKYLELYFERIKDGVKGQGIADADIVEWMSRNREMVIQRYFAEWRKAVKKG